MASLVIRHNRGCCYGLVLFWVVNTQYDTGPVCRVNFERRLCMLYEVRVMKPNGKIKEVIPVERLSQRYWSQFYNANKEISIPGNWKTRVPHWVQERLDIEFF